MQHIYKKELDSYFNNMLGYVFIMIFLFLCGFYFVMNNLAARSSDVAAVFSNVSFLMIVMIPLLTMRTFAEEKKNKTDILILRSSVGIPKTVLGKFFSSLTVVLIALLATIVYIVIAAVLGSVILPEVLLGYMGFILLSACMIAVGMFVSSFTENQLIAAVVTMGLLLLMWLANSARASVGTAFLDSLIRFVSPFANFAAFGTGVFRFPALVNMLCFIALFLGLNCFSLDFQRVRGGKR